MTEHLVGTGWPPGTLVMVRVPGHRDRIGKVTHRPRGESVRVQMLKLDGKWSVSGQTYSTRFVTRASSDETFRFGV